MAKQLSVNLTENGCMEVINLFVDNEGYPRLNLNGSSRHAARTVYAHTYGDIPKGLVVRHACDNPT